MSTEFSIPFLDGHLAAVDHGGQGADVVLLHPPGENLGTWHTLLPYLWERHHVWALDLPGHGRSTAHPRDAFDVADAIVALCHQAGLERPVLVADDATGYHATLAATRLPRVGALVLTSGFFLGTCTEIQSVLDLFADVDLTREVTADRFCLGERGTTEKEKHQLANRLFSRTGEGWMQAGAREGALAMFVRSMPDRPDGTWVRTPEAAALCACFDVDRSGLFYPSARLLGRVPAPVHMIVSTDGADAQVTDRVFDRTTPPVPRNVLLHVAALGEAPRHTAPQEVAAVVDAAVRHAEYAHRPEGSTPGRGVAGVV